MIVSVIIPVFNASRYIEQAVHSALAQPETGEVLLVEDGSSDNSLSICEKIRAQSPKVRLFRHPQGQNRGAGASRNLGITHARYNYIAFLDADDFYLPGRFQTTAQIFQKDHHAEGVYEATGTQFESEIIRASWFDNPLHKGRLITAVDPAVQPEKLFGVLVSGVGGSFTTDAIVVKRHLFDRAGPFDEDLALHQDTVMWIKLSAVGRLVAGNRVTPVAIRRVHTHNRISSLPRGPNPHLEKMDQILYRWAKQQGLDRGQRKLLSFRRWCNRLYGYDLWKRAAVENESARGWVQIQKRAVFMSKRLLSSPALIFSPHLFFFLFGYLKRTTLLRRNTGV